MSKPNIYDHDLFISYARADLDWVDVYLLPSLGLPPERVITPRQSTQGASLMAEFEQAIQSSCLTLLIYLKLKPRLQLDCTDAANWNPEVKRLRAFLVLPEPNPVGYRMFLPGHGAVSAGGCKTLFGAGR